jgi:hypothetical protein
MKADGYPGYKPWAEISELLRSSVSMRFPGVCAKPLDGDT